MLILTRVTDADSSTQVTGGLFTFVEEGSNNADNAYVLTSVAGTATLGRITLYLHNSQVHRFQVGLNLLSQATLYQSMLMINQ